VTLLDNIDKAAADLGGKTHEVVATDRAYKKTLDIGRKLIDQLLKDVQLAK
jgi:hypothetical protein